MGYRDQGIYFDKQISLTKSILLSNELEKERIHDYFYIDPDKFLCIKDVPGEEFWEINNRLSSFQEGKWYKGTKDLMTWNKRGTYINLFKGCGGCTYDNCFGDCDNRRGSATPMTEEFFKEHFISSVEIRENLELKAKEKGIFNGWTEDKKCFQCGSSNIMYFKIYDMPWLKSWVCENYQIVSYSGNKMYEDYYNDSKKRKDIWLHDHEIGQLLARLNGKYNTQSTRKPLEKGTVHRYFFQKINKTQILDEY